MSSLIFNQNAFAIDQFRANFLNGARGYLFYVVPTFPSYISSTSTISPTYLVRSSSIPARTIAETSTNWQGYTYPLGGKSQFNDWSITFTVDKECSIYNQYIKWVDMVHDPETNVHGDPINFSVDQSAQLLSLDGRKGILKITCIGCWPQSVSELSLDYSGSDVLTFTVTFKLIRVKYEK